MIRSAAGAAIAVALAVAVLGAVLVRPARAGENGEAIAIDARPLAGFSAAEPGRTRFGALDFVGGFEIGDARRRIGGLSGLVVLDGGRRLLSQSDDGIFLVADIRRDARGVPVGLDNARIGPLMAADGKRLAGKRDADAESIDIAVASGGRRRLLMSFEGRRPRLMTAPLQADGFPGPLSPVPLPPATAGLDGNSGLESVAALPGGRILVLGEETERGAPTPDRPGWVIGDRRPVAFRIRDDGFSLTDAKVGPDGLLYVLERRYRPPFSLAARLRRFALADIRPGAVIDGDELMTATLAETIDNMEGLALWRDGAGATRIAMVSDDNRSPLQRTLYLEFRLAEGGR